MQKVLKTIISVFAVIGILSVVVLIIYFSTDDDSDRTECVNSIPIDTTTIARENGIEDFKDFKFHFITKHNFQESRVKFPIKGMPKGWSMDNWTTCNWKTLTPFFMDTITYGIRKPKLYKESPYEKEEEIFIKFDSSRVAKLTFKLENFKWYLVERIQRK